MTTQRLLKRVILALISLISISISALIAVAAASPADAAAAPRATMAPLARVAALHQPALVAAYAADRHIPAGDVAGVRPGELHIGYDAATKTYWALAMFFPSARAHGAALLGFQDGGSTGVFTRQRNSHWRMIGYASLPLSCTVTVPSSVRHSWGFTSSGCANTGKTKPGPKPPLYAPNAVNPSTIASVAQQQVGVGDNPASLNFNFNCNPFTTMVGRGQSTSGCGTDAKFNVRNENERWCSDFAEWVWEQGGVNTNLGVITGGADTFYTWARDRGQNPQFDSGTPHVGDAIVFYPSGTTDAYGYADHVGLIVGVNSDGTLNLVNGDFAGTSNIRVEADNNVSPTPWAGQVWGSGEKWLLVSPTATGLAGGPAVYDPLSGNLEVYGTGTDGALWQRAFDPGTGWSGWINLGGSITGTPSAVYDPINGHLEVYVRGALGSLFEKYWSGSWSGWINLGGSITGSPVAIYDPASGKVEVYATGSGGTLQQIAWNKSGWSAWSDLGGSISGDPSPVYDPANGHLEIYVRGAGGPLFQKAWSPSGGWSGWVNLGGSITGSPAAVYDPASGNIEVYATGSGGTLEQIAWNPASGWTGWSDLGGSVAGRPSPVYNPGTDHLEIYILGAGGPLFQRYWSPSGGWSSWVDLGGSPLTGSPDAIADPANGDLEGYALTTAHSVWEAYWVPSNGWHNGDLGGSLADL